MDGSLGSVETIKALNKSPYPPAQPLPLGSAMMLTAACEQLTMVLHPCHGARQASTATTRAEQ